MRKNTGLIVANTAKKDEFYTSYDDIKKELVNYAKYFKGKVIYCNCDDHYGIGKGTPKSNFIKYLADNFQAFGIKKVIATHYEAGKKSTMYILNKDNTGDGIICSEDIEEIPLKSDGDFRSAECIELLKQADIVITNPPFSLFREYVAQLMEYKKKFIIIGNQNAITYKEFFPLIKANKVWLGMTMDSSNRWFAVPDDYEQYHKIENGVKYAFVAGVVWFTNLPHSKRNEKLETGKTYHGFESMYPKYDNYDAIEVSTVRNIPMDYTGMMGVPISFLHKYNPDQFEIIGLERYTAPKEILVGGRLAINGKSTYARILIKSKKGGQE